MTLSSFCISRTNPRPSRHSPSACFATLRLDPAKMQLISGFVDSYLRLNDEEREAFGREVSVLTRDEQETVMQLTTSWKEEGIVEGLRRGKKELVIRLLRRRFGDVP